MRPAMTQISLLISSSTSLSFLHCGRLGQHGYPLISEKTPSRVNIFQADLIIAGHNCIFLNQRFIITEDLNQCSRVKYINGFI